MDSVNTIVAAIDFSKYSEGTLRLAAGMSQDFGAKLIVLHVLNQRDVDALKFVSSATSMINMEEVLEQRKADRLQLIDKYMQDAQCGEIGYEKKLRIGTPWEEIIDEVKESNADMVVISTKGKSNLEHALFGSQADKLYRHCPVTVVSARGKLHQDTVCKLRGYDEDN